MIKNFHFGVKSIFFSGLLLLLLAEMGQGTMVRRGGSNQEMMHSNLHHRPLYQSANHSATAPTELIHYIDVLLYNLWYLFHRTFHIRTYYTLPTSLVCSSYNLFCHEVRVRCPDTVIPSTQRWLIDFSLSMILAAFARYRIDSCFLWKVDGRPVCFAQPFLKCISFLN